LETLAELLEYKEAENILERPFVHYIGNQPIKALNHFHGLREAVSHLKGIAVFDRLEKELLEDPNLIFQIWKKREIENYLCSVETLESYAMNEELFETAGPLFSKAESQKRLNIMGKCIKEVESAMKILGKGSPWDSDTKVSDDFLAPLFTKYFEELSLPNIMAKKNFHQLARFVPKEKIDPEIKEKLEDIVRVAKSAKPFEEIS
jgi:hypothetical protein